MPEYGCNWFGSNWIPNLHLIVRSRWEKWWGSCHPSPSLYLGPQIIYQVSLILKWLLIFFGTHRRAGPKKFAWEFRGGSPDHEYFIFRCFGSFLDFPSEFERHLVTRPQCCKWLRVYESRFLKNRSFHGVIALYYSLGIHYFRIAVFGGLGAHTELNIKAFTMLRQE